MKHILNQSRRWIGIAFLVIAITAGIDFMRPNAEAAPEFLNYQGTLTDNAGQPLPNGPHQLVFNIYDTAQPGGVEQHVWGPFAAQAEIVQGRFNVVLGPSDTAAEPRSLKEAFQGDGDRFIEITVGGGAPILPRQQFLSTPYAVSAHHADNGVPVGTIIPWWGNLSEMPDGFLPCDGQLIVIPGAVLTGNTPDLRERFLRGAPAGSSAMSDLEAPEATGGADSRSLNLDHVHSLKHTHRAGDGHGDLAARIGMSAPGGGSTIYMRQVNDPDSDDWTINRSQKNLGSSGNVNNAQVGVGAEVWGKTGAASTSNTGNPSSNSVSFDNRPAYREVHFLIRVK